ncbi:MAG: hypothetical protein KJT03_00280 [Verrucomicrobiae bacterium]|nr:hypothetical protein [Verrucomicrobiae bacterium]
MATRSNGSFSSWAQVSATTDLNPWTKTFNVKNYGAVGNGIVDDTKAIRATIQAVYAEGGGIVYLPSGTYAVAPDAGAGVIFYLEKGNIFFKGDGPDKTIISCFVSGMRDPETNWDYNDKGELTRGICFILNLKWLVRNSNFVFEDLRVTGNARPTGDTLWWTNEQKENGWDISHKGIYLGSMNDNILLRNTVWDNFRGEIVYSGDPWGGKLKMEDCKVYGTNSSAISTSADFECLRTEVWDAANACVESAFFKDLNDIENTPQNGIFKDSIFRNRDKMLTDKSANPLLTDETTGLEGLAIFNAPGTYMVVDNCEIRNTSKWGILMDVGQRNFAVLDTIFEDCSRIGGIYTETKDKKDYQLTGEIINFLVEGCTFIANTDSIIFDTANFHPKLQKDMLFRNNKIYLNGGKSIIHFDSHNHEGLRENLVFDGNEVIYNGGKLVRFSYDVNKSSYPAIKPIWKENNKFSIPDYFESGDATEYVLYNTPAGPQNLVIHGPYMKVYNLPAGSLVELEITQYLHRYPEGFQTTFLRSASQGRAVFRKNPEWNDFPEDIYLDKGNSFNIRKEDSLFRLKEWNGKRVLSFRDRGFFDAVAANDTAATYGVFTGVADHEEVIVAVTEDNVTLENNDRLRLSNNTSYTHIGAPVEFKFVRDGNVLIEIERQSCNRSLVKLD